MGTGAGCQPIIDNHYYKIDFSTTDPPSVNFQYSNLIAWTDYSSSSCNGNPYEVFMLSPNGCTVVAHGGGYSNGGGWSFKV